MRAALQTEGRLLELWRLASSHESVFRSDPELSWHWDMARRQLFGESPPMIEQLIEDGRRGVPPSWTAAAFTNRYVPTLQSLEALRDGYLSVSIARFERSRNREAMRLAVLVATALGTLVVLGMAPHCPPADPAATAAGAAAGDPAYLGYARSARMSPTRWPRCSACSMPSKCCARNRASVRR